MDIKVAFVVLLSAMELCACSEMSMQQIINFDLFSLTNSTLSPYLTKVSIGNPPKSFNVLIDTGSDITWVDCSNTGANFYNVLDSRTASVVDCEGGMMPCKVNISYKDGSQSTLFMASDEFHFRTLLLNMTQSQLSSRIIFGLGWYQVSLESISVNNKHISAKPHEGSKGTVFDSGTTLMLLAAEVYDSVVDAVSFVVNKSALPEYPGSCYDVPLMSSFPQIKLFFANGASMLLMPHDYLLVSPP